MAKVKVIQLKKDLPLPFYQTKGSAAMDVHAAESLTLKAGEFKVITTGLKLALPEGYELQIRPRSGLAFKHGISLVNSPATIDSDFRGELGLILVNHGKEDFQVNYGDRIAQMILHKFEAIEWEPVEILDETERGEGGLGSTGISFKK